MVKEFKDLEVWKRSHDIVIKIYMITKAFPKEEMFGLTGQLRRASSSIAANIAEGFERYHPKDKIRFYYNARGSMSESKNHVMLAKDLKYISSVDAEELLSELNIIGKQLNALINSLRKFSQSLAARSQ